MSLRLKDEQMLRLQREANRLGRTPSQTAALLLEESLRQRDFPFIEFRDSPVGRQAYLKGTRIAAWHIARIAREGGGDPAEIAALFDVPVTQIRSVLAYTDAYAEETNRAIADDDWAADHLIPHMPGYASTEVDAPPS